MTMYGTPIKATAGMTFTSPAHGNIGAIDWEVKESCGGKKGYWYCITHKRAFSNQFNRDMHYEHPATEHVMCWICWECGNAEVP
jgi:hypothetical protein